MWNAASIALALGDAGDYGFDVKTGGSDWASLKAKRDAYIERLNGIYARNLAAKGVTLVRARPVPRPAHRRGRRGAPVRASHRDRHRRRARRARAAGRRPRNHSDGFFALERRPQRVAVVGSGYIACELAGVFHDSAARCSSSSAGIRC